MTASAFSSVHDFFHSSAWYVIRNLAILILVVFWVATVYWVYKDARRRIADPLLVGVSTLVGVLPFVGPLIYMLFRPPEYLEDVRERDLEIRAMEARLGGVEARCPVCRAQIGADYLRCPVCTTRLRQACATCHRPLEPAWRVCPYCETPVPGAAAAAEPLPVDSAAKETPKKPSSRARASGADAKS